MINIKAGITAFCDSSYNLISNPFLSPEAKNKISRIFWISLACWSVYNLVDSGLAHFLALETLPHGTGPLGYIGINLFGADPNYGGGSTGSSAGTGHEPHLSNSKNFFYVFKDSEFPTDNHSILEQVVEYGNLLPRLHAILSGMGTCGYTLNDGTQNLARGIVGGALGFLTPTLKFRFTPDAVICGGKSCRFQNDECYGNVAYKTAQPISAIHLGITGSLTQGINSNFWQRIASHPKKVAFGVALLTTAAIVAKLTYSYINSPPQKIEEIPAPSPKTCCQSFKGRAKALLKNTLWEGLALTIITLNTL